MATQFTPNLPGSNNGAASTEGRRVDQYDRDYDHGVGCAEAPDYEAMTLAVKGKLTSQGYHNDGFVVEDGDEEGDVEFSDDEEEDEAESEDSCDEEDEVEFSDEEEEDEEDDESTETERAMAKAAGILASHVAAAATADEEDSEEEEDVEHRADRMASQVENILLEGLSGSDAVGDVSDTRFKKEGNRVFKDMSFEKAVAQMTSMCVGMVAAEKRNDTTCILDCLSDMKEAGVVTEQLLRETGAGKTVNGIRKYKDGDGLVRSAAKALVKEWRRCVATKKVAGTE